jgi:hypothetical protein
VTREAFHTARATGLWRRLAFLLLSLIAIGCAGVGRDLHTVSQLYRDARYEAAQAWCSALSVEYADMTPAQRVMYHYLSGMTAYRLSQPTEAEHELALTAHALREQPSVLDTAQLAVLYRTLEELSPMDSSSNTLIGTQH